MRLPPSSSRPTSRAGVACAVAVLLVDLWSFANGQLLDPSAGTALGAAAANLAGGGIREASNLLKETGLGASFAEAGGAAAKAAVGALAAGANADVRTMPNANGRPGVGGRPASSWQQTERHKELDRASEAIGSGRQQVLGGGGGGGASIFSMMGTAPGAELMSAASAPKDYTPKPYREDFKGGTKKDAAAAAAANDDAPAAAASSSDGGRSFGPLPLPNQPGTGGAGFDPQSSSDGGGSLAPGAKSFPGSGDAPRASLYATNDAGTGPAPVSGGGFQPLESGGGFADGGKVMGGGGGGGGGVGGVVGGGGGGKSATPLLGGGGSAPASVVEGSSVAPAPLVGGAVVGQDGRASLPVNSLAQQQQQQQQPQMQPPQPPQPPQPSSSSSSSNGGVGSDGLVHAPGGAASSPLGVVDTQPATTAVTGTAPGGLPFKMTIGKRRRRRSRMMI